MPMTEPQKRGRKRQAAIYKALKAAGREVKQQKHSHCPFDLLVDGKRIEVKASIRLAGKNHCTGTWLFNLHRHNKLDESGVDYYILALSELPGMKQSMYLLVPAPIGKKLIVISIFSLIRGEWAKAAQDFQSFKRGEL